MIIAFVGAAAQAWATDMTLTVTAGGKQSVYSVEDLESLGTQGFETTTSWTDGPQFFEGVDRRVEGPLVGHEPAKG